jgi:hypothetical protein
MPRDSANYGGWEAARYRGHRREGAIAGCFGLGSWRQILPGPVLRCAAPNAVTSGDSRDKSEIRAAMAFYSR